jgi:hypothetical protein
LPHEFQAAVIYAVIAQNAVDKRRFAAAVKSHQKQHLAGLKLKVYAAKHVVLSVRKAHLAAFKEHAASAFAAHHPAPFVRFNR